MYHFEDVNENMTSYGNHTQAYTADRQLQYALSLHASKQFEKNNWKLKSRSVLPENWNQDL